jgi:hypothetical protein
VLAAARILDNPRALSSQPAAARVVGTLLDRLRSESMRGRRGNLALVRQMSRQGRLMAEGDFWAALAAADDLAAINDRQLAPLLADHRPRFRRVQYV